jgi:hypothetical protein
MRIVSLTLAILLTAAVATADTVVLVGGGTLDGRIVKESEDEVVIEVEGMGSMTVPRGRIREIRRDDGEEPPPPAEDEPTPEPEPAPPAGDDRAGPARPILDAYVAALPADQRVPSELVRKTLAELRPLGRRATPDLANALVTAKDWRVRLLAVKGLHPLSDSGAADALIHALGDPFKGEISTAEGSQRIGRPIADEALAALGRMGAKAHRPLLTTASSRRHPDQVLAVRALGKIDVPRKAQVLAGLARDTSQKPAVRKEAVLALSGEGAREISLLADLIGDRVVGDQAGAALKEAKDRSAIEPLMKHVRNALRDYETARRSAWTIGWIDERFIPRDVEDCVDYLLFFEPRTRVKEVLGDRALPRLREWSNSRSAEMKKAAKEALAAY